MKQSELVALIASQTGESKAAVSRVLSALSDVTLEVVEAGGYVPIGRVGRIGSRWRRRTAVRGVRDGMKRMVGGRHVPVFRASAGFKRRLVGKTPQYWREPEHQRAWRLAESLVGDLELYSNKKPSLVPGMAPTAVREACRRTLGEDWARAELTFAEEVPASVREVVDYLVEVATEQWG